MIDFIRGTAWRRWTASLLVAASFWAAAPALAQADDGTHEVYGQLESVNLYAAQRVLRMNGVDYQFSTNTPIEWASGVPADLKILAPGVQVNMFVREINGAMVISRIVLAMA